MLDGRNNDKSPVSQCHLYTVAKSEMLRRAARELELCFALLLVLRKSPDPAIE
jgi:hypothetical protein